jgi:hypothetical protein
MINNNKKDTADNIQAETISDLPLANQLAEQMKAGTGTGSRDDFADIISGSGRGASPHVK